MLKVFSKEMLVLKQIEKILNDNPWLYELDKLPKGVQNEFDVSISDECFVNYYEEDENFSIEDLVFSKDIYIANKVNEIIELLQKDSWASECDGLTEKQIIDKGYCVKKAGMIPKCK